MQKKTPGIIHVKNHTHAAENPLALDKTEAQSAVDGLGGIVSPQAVEPRKKCLMSRSSIRSIKSWQPAHWRLIFACACIVVISFHMVSCSRGSGSWDDDAKNWSRAFAGQQQPPDVKVAHSRYWKSPHFTYEAEYFFEFTAPQKFLDAWIAGQNLVPVQPTKENTPPYFERPGWFAPKPLGDYEMWLPADDPYGKFRIYRDRSTGTLFVTDCST